MIVAGLVVAALALWLAMSPQPIWLRRVAAAAAALGLLAAVGAFEAPGRELVSRTLFWLFASGALVGAVLLVTGRDPVHSALWFAVSTLCVCGLFLELSAPFLAAATLIVYAGAIIVTFMFVIMLAQQGGATAYDQRPRLPLAGSLTSFFVLGALAFSLLTAQRNAVEPAEGPALVSAAGLDGARSAVSLDEAARLATLGRALFGHYLFAVEIGGTLLLIAMVGAIALAPRRQRGNL